MAALTTGPGIIFLADEGFMDVLVAITATVPNIPEAPGVFLFVTFCACNGEMGALQSKGTAVMLFDGVQGLIKTFCGMAKRAIRRRILPGKLSPVVILMTVHALFMPDANGETSFMTGIAGNRCMFVLQGETCRCMIKPGSGFTSIKRFRCMALGAILPEPVSMRVGMAAAAIFIGEPGKFLEFPAILCGHFMALDAGYHLVPAC